MERKLIAYAALSLLGWSLVTAIALVAFFARAESPWTWRSIATLVFVFLGVTSSALVWRAPSRTHLAVGLFVMALSLVRMVPMGGESFAWAPAMALAALTTLLAVPLVRALRK